MNILAAESRASLSKSHNIGMTISLLRQNFDNFIKNHQWLIFFSKINHRYIELCQNSENSLI